MERLSFVYALPDKISVRAAIGTKMFGCNFVRDKVTWDVNDTGVELNYQRVLLNRKFL